MMAGTYTGYKCKCGHGIHTTFDGSGIVPCKKCGNTSGTMKRQMHKWVLSGWEDRGRKPRADEWECVHCGLVVDDGERAPSRYCEEGEQE
jgi:hypothetical protein